MATLQIVTTMQDNMWVLTFQLLTPSDIPTDIFMYENTGNGLGLYYGVTTLEDYQRFQTYQEGTSVPIFANKFLKYTVGTMTFNTDTDPQTIRNKISADIASFKVAYNSNASSATTVTI